MTLQSIPTPAASLQMSHSLSSHQNSSTSQARLSISSNISNPSPGLLNSHGLVGMVRDLSEEEEEEEEEQMVGAQPGEDKD